MLFISGEDMEKALEEFQDSEPSLEYRLWHVCANRIATSILMKQTAYQVSPFEQSRSYWADIHWSVCLLLVKQPVIGQKLLYLLMIWRKGINAVHELVCFRAGPRRRSSYSWRTPTYWTLMTSMCSQSTQP